MKRARTTDLAAAPGDGRTVAYTKEQLGPNRAMLPNGNLICYSVPLARTGWLIYGPQEVPVKPGQQGVAYVERTADTLFAPETVASFQGAALTIGHPDVDVDPTNWEALAGGYTINVRRGTGDDADVLLGDIIVTRKRFIDAILAGLMEVSPGYDADYRDCGGGIGSQHNILGNHVALVKKGRCGPRCAIGDAAHDADGADESLDHNHHQESYSMPAVTNGAPLARRPITADTKRQRVLDAQAELDAATDDLGSAAAEDGVHVHVHNYGGEPAAKPGGEARTLDAAVEERFTKIEGSLGSIAETLKTLTAKTGDEFPAGKEGEDEDDEEKKAKAKKTKDEEGAGTDSAALGTSYTELASLAEILQPGFKVPTFDAAMTRAKTVDRMCAVRRKVLDGFGSQPTGSALLMAVNGGTAPDLLGMDCAGVATLFKTAATAKAAANNAGVATRDAAPAAAAPRRGAGVPSIAEINAKNADFWKGK